MNQSRELMIKKIPNQVGNDGTFALAKFASRGEFTLSKVYR
jgi:hypothetical protein